MLALESKGLVLYKLRYPKSIRNIDDVSQLEESEVHSKVLELAVGLVDYMEVLLGDLDLTDRDNEALRDMIWAKVEGRQVVTAPDEEPEVVDIMTALRESIEQTKALAMKKAARKARKPAKKVA